jgi:hypothetical protein
MKPLDFKHILQSLVHLSHWQRDRLVQVVRVMPWRGLRPVSTLRRSALTAHTHNFIGTDAPRGFSAIGAAPAAGPSMP